MCIRERSGGVSKESCCITIIDSKTTRVFAELRSNVITLIEFARVIEWIVLNLMPNAVINIERNGVAIATSVYMVTYIFYSFIALKKVRAYTLQRNL